MRAPELRSVGMGLASGILIAGILAAIPTGLDWYGNASGLFRSDSGTSWSVVFETWISWFWPLALVATPCAVLAHVKVRGGGVSKDA